ASLGDVEGYRKQCRELLARVPRDANPKTARYTVAACGLMPDAVPDFAPVLRLAEVVAADAGKNGGPYWSWHIRGLAAYRARDHDGVIYYLARGTNTAPERALSRRPLRALAEHQPGKGSTAREALAKARMHLTDRPRAERGQSFGDTWHEWLAGELLLREAERLIEGKPTDQGNKK